MNVAQLFASALERHRAGALAEAEPLYRRVLAIDPRHADALHLLGLAAAQGGRYAEAADLIGRAVRLRPGLAAAQYNLGGALRELGRDAEAASAYRRALDLEPGHADAAINLGLVLHRLGRHEEALAACQRAIGLRPADATALNNLGAALRALGRSQEALGAYQRAVQLAPGYAEAFNNLASALRQLGRTQAALAAAERALQLKPDFADACANLGGALHEAGRSEEAIAACRRAVALRPDSAAAHVNLSIALQGAGETAEGAKAAERALAIDPTCAAAWRTRAELKTFAAGDPDLDAIEAVLAAGPAGFDDRVDLEFAAGKAWMDAGDADRAFAHLDAGNRLMRGAFDYDVEAHVRRMEATARVFSPEAIARFEGAGEASDAPVFVVGVPRSGTTLVEQILASHPRVHGAGELTLLGDLAARAAPRGDWERLLDGPPERLAALGRDYVEAARALAPGKARVVDKMPGNFQFVGLIGLMLPGARIIHCRRDPRDTGLSCYSRRFAEPQPFAYDLREFGLHHRGYQALMAHWRALEPPERLLEVDYEAVVDDLETQARRLVAFCGLEWSDACLSFHETRRAVRTASLNQVRQPIYRGSVGRWRAFGSHLQPLIDALEPAAC